jgi:hypothetical protein
MQYKVSQREFYFQQDYSFPNSLPERQFYLLAYNK